MREEKRREGEKEGTGSDALFSSLPPATYDLRPPRRLGPPARRTMPRLFALALLALAACDSAAPVVTRALEPTTYTVTLDATWSAATHPEAFPPNPHFSPLVGAAHGAGTGLWSVGEAASDGVRDMAERGVTGTLRAEVEALPAARYAEGGGVATSPGTAALALTVDAERPLATVVSMLAPSPDWFVGVDGLDLRDGDGWHDRVTVSLVVYDAGTDDGAAYTAANAPATPRAPIAEATYVPLAGTTVGTLTFVRAE